MVLHHELEQHVIASIHSQGPYSAVRNRFRDRQLTEPATGRAVSVPLVRLVPRRVSGTITKINPLPVVSCVTYRVRAQLKHLNCRYGL